MVKYKVTYDRTNCIGAGSCAAMAPGLFTIVGDGKADMKDSKEDNGKFEVVVDENPAILEAAKSCPVEVIKVKNVETGEDLV